MTKKVERLKLKRASRILWGVLAVLLVVLITAFSRALTTNQSLRQELDAMRPIMTAAYEEQNTLKAELAYVQSDEYIEKWSREHAAMTKPDEVLVIPVKEPAAPDIILTPTPLPETTAPPATPVPFWQRWWHAVTEH